MESLYQNLPFLCLTLLRKKTLCVSMEMESLIYGYVSKNVEPIEEFTKERKMMLKKLKEKMIMYAEIINYSEILAKYEELFELILKFYFSNLIGFVPFFTERMIEICLTPPYIDGSFTHIKKYLSTKKVLEILHHNPWLIVDCEQTIEQCQVVISSGSPFIFCSPIKYIKNQSLELVEYAIDHDPHFRLDNINPEFITTDIVKKIVRKKEYTELDSNIPLSLYTEDFCLDLVRLGRTDLLKDIPEDNISTRVCQEAIRINGSFVRKFLPPSKLSPDLGIDMREDGISRCEHPYFYQYWNREMRVSNPRSWF